MFDIIFSKLLSDPILRAPGEKQYKGISVQKPPYISESDDVAPLLYHLDLLLEILRLGDENIRAVCTDDRVVLDAARLEFLEKRKFSG